jgi:hypothetical protein
MTKRSASAHPRLRSSLRAAAAAVAVAMSLVPQTQARASGDVKLIANQANWFWSSNTKLTICQPPPVDGAPGVCGPASLTGGVFGTPEAGTTSPISTGHLGVAMKKGDSDMRSYVQFDLSSILPGSTISEFRMTMLVSNPDQAHSPQHQDRELHAPATINQNAATIRACAVAEPWAGASGGDGGDPPYSSSIADASKIDPGDPNASVTTVKNEPAADCGFSVNGEKSKDGSTWTFDLKRLAQAWVDGDIFNNGVALLPEARGVDPTWTIEFHGAETKRRLEDGTYRIINAKSQAPFVSAIFEDPVVPPTPAPQVIVNQPPPVVPNGPVQFPTFSNPDPVAVPTTGPIAPVVRPVATVGRTPGWVWALVPLGLLGLGLVSVAVGPDNIAFAAVSGNRVASLLRGRRLASPDATPISEENP